MWQPRAAFTADIKRKCWLEEQFDGLIEGACRHLVKDRMDITGARWILDGAEAVLKMRAVVSNRDFEEYWRYHQAHEHQRVHCARYAPAAQRLTLAA